MRLSLLHCERKLIAKHGRDWRLRVLDDEVVQFLKVKDYVHKQIEYRGFIFADFNRLIASVKSHNKQLTTCSGEVQL